MRMVNERGRRVSLHALIREKQPSFLLHLRLLLTLLPPRASEDSTGQQQGHQRRPVGITVNMCFLVLLTSVGQTATGKGTTDDQHCSEVYGSPSLLLIQVPGSLPLSFVFLAHWKTQGRRRETTPKPIPSSLRTGRSAGPFGQCGPLVNQ